MGKAFTSIGLVVLLTGCVGEWAVRKKLDAGAEAQESDADGAAQGRDDDAGQDAETGRVEQPDPEGGCMAPEPLCSAGESLACTTSCGSTGTGECSETCGVPAPSACEAPAEVCNRRDDDCDGVADEGSFWTQEPPVFRPLTQAGFGPQAIPIGAMLELAPRSAGGAWLFYSARYGAIEVARLDAAGERVSSSTLAGTSEVNEFLADEEHGAIALVTTEGGAGAPASASRLRVRLLSGSDLSSLAEFEPIAESNMAYRLFATALLNEANGGRRVLVVYGQIPDNGKAPAYTMQMRIFTLDEQGERAVGLPVEIGQVGAPGGGPPLVAAEVRHLPCRDEWLLSAQFSVPSGGSENRLQRVSIDAIPMGPALIEVLPGFASLAGVSRGVSCAEGGSSQLALIFAQPVTLRAALRLWHVDDETGAIEVPGSGGNIDLGIGLGNARAVRWAGRWFVFGFTATDTAAWDAPKLLEVSEKDGGVTPLPLFAPGGPDPGLTNALSFFLRVDNGLALIHAGERLVAVVGAGMLDDQPALTSTDPVNKRVVAASYAFGCP